MADKPPSAWQIENAVSAWQRGRAMLLTGDAELAVDEATLQELLGPETDDVNALLDRTLRAAIHAKSMVEAAEMQITNLKGRKDRYARRYEACRATASAIMEALAKRTYQMPELTASIRNGAPYVRVIDEDKLEDRFFRVIPAKREVDKGALKAAMEKDGEVLNGAVLSNGASYLVIKVT